MTSERPEDQALETATDRLIDAQASVGRVIDRGERPDPDRVEVVVRRAEDVESLAEEATDAASAAAARREPEVNGPE